MHATRSLTLELLPDRFAVCRLAPDSPVPPRPAQASLWSVTCTAGELSIVLPEECAPPKWQAEKDWRCLQVAGPLAFELVGILASLLTPLAAAGISVFTLSTYDTDYILLPSRHLEQAIDALVTAGHTVRGYASPRSPTGERQER